MVTIFHNPRCRKSRETLAILHGKGKQIHIREYLKEPPSREELQEVVSLLGVRPFRIVRKNEAEYKDNFKGKDLTDEQWLDALITYPKLIERPIVIYEKRAVIGRPPENVNEIL